MTLDHVMGVVVQRVSDAPPEQPVLSCEAVGAGYRLVVTSHDGLQMQCMVQSLVGAFADIGEPVDPP